MPDYAKIVDGEVVEYGPEPDAFTMKNKKGELVSVSTPEGVPTDPSILAKAGYLPIEVVEPEYDPATQYLGEPVFKVQKTKVISKRRVVDRIPEPLTPVEIRVEDMAQQIMQLSHRLDLLERHLLTPPHLYIKVNSVGQYYRSDGTLEAAYRSVDGKWEKFFPAYLDPDYVWIEK